MRYLLGLILLVSVSASAQYSPTAAKTRFVNGIGLGTKDTLSMNAADTAAMIVGRDSLVYFRYKGYWKPLAYNSSLTGYVPYTGATSSVNLGAYGITTNFAQFNSISAPSYSQGLMWYDNTQKALAYYNDITNNTLHIGQEVQLKVHNNSGANISIGSPVYVTGTTSGYSYPNVALAKADALSTSNVIGLTNQAIANGADGYVVVSGLLTGLNTGTYTVGNTLYLSPYSAGQLMNTLPPTGYAVRVGVVSYVNSSNGNIYINQSLAGTVTSVATDATLTGGTITNSGTLKVDTSVMATRLRVQKGIDSLGALDASKYVPYTGATGSVNLGAYNLTATSIIKTGGTSAQFLKADGSVDANAYLPLTGGTMTGQIVLKQSSSSTDYTKGLKFPDNSFGGSSDVAGFRLYSLTGEDQVLEMYVGNDSIADIINFATGVGGNPDNNAVKINGNTIWNAANLPSPQSSITLTTTGTSGAATFTSNTLNIPQYQAAGTYVTSVTGTSPIVSSGGTTPAISIPAATSSVNGYLTSTDWTTFNNKQSALTNPVTGTGTTNYLPKFTGSSTIGNSLIQDDGSGVSIGGSPTSCKFKVYQSNSALQSFIASHVNGNQIQVAASYNYYDAYNHIFRSLAATTTYATIDNSGNLGLGVTPSVWYTTFQAFQFGANGSSIFGRSENNMAAFASNAFVNAAGSFTYINTNTASYYQQLNGSHQWYNAPSGTAGAAIYFTQAMTLFSDGNLLLTNSTVTDAGYKLDVNGTGRFSGMLSVSYASFPEQRITDGTIGYQIYASTGSGEAVLGTYTNHNLILRTNGTPRLSIASTGAATFSSTLGINGVSDNVKSGSYAPTITASVNVTSASNVGDAIYSRVGNVVTVSGMCSVSNTAVGATIITISLPIASSLSSSGDGNGTGAYYTGGAHGVAQVYSNSSGVMVLSYTALGVNSPNISYQFTYLIN